MGILQSSVNSVWTTAGVMKKAGEYLTEQKKQTTLAEEARKRQEEQEKKVQQYREATQGMSAEQKEAYDKELERQDYEKWLAESPEGQAEAAEMQRQWEFEERQNEEFERIAQSVNPQKIAQGADTGSRATLSGAKQKTAQKENFRRRMKYYRVGGKK